jgi:hypothetical protein
MDDLVEKLMAVDATEAAKIMAEATKGLSQVNIESITDNAVKIVAERYAGLLTTEEARTFLSRVPKLIAGARG